MANDLNAPKALGSFWELIKDEQVAAQQKLGALLEMDRVLGLGIASIEAEELDPEFEAEVQALVDEREKARSDKDYVRADEIRKQLRQKQVILEDTPSGPRWKKEKL
jgi:cysteinyl-tRNA synthetase